MVLNVCVVGAGRMGRLHARSVAGLPTAHLLTVADPNLDSANALATPYGADATTEVRAAITSDAIDAVVIASPTDTHVEYIELAASAGKAIFSEKPVGTERSAVERCLETVGKHGALLQIGFNRRFDPSFVGVKQAIEAGRIGAVELVVLTSRDPELPPPGYIETSGGLFRDFAIHDFDMARWLLGEEPIEVMAYGSNLVDPSVGAAGDVDTTMVILRTERGALCHINNSRRAVYGYDQRAEVHGSLGMAQAQNRGPATVEVSTAVAVESTLPYGWFPERYAEAYVAEIASFVDCASNGGVPRVSGEDGLRAQLIADAATESLHSGQPARIG